MTMGRLEGSAADEGSFERLVQQHGGRLYGLAYLVLQDTGLAEDAVQDALLRAWRHLPSLRSKDRVESWLTSIVLNASRDQARRARLRRLLPVFALGPPPSADPQHELPVVDEVHQALRAISERHRAVLVLRYYLDLDLGAIAAQLGVPEGTVRSRIHHGLRALRAALDAQNRGVS